MPIYNYDCPGCGARTERTCAVADRDAQLCVCGGILRRQFSTGVQVVIPTGWHTSFSDIGPSTPESEKVWRDLGVRRVGSRWV